MEDGQRIQQLVPETNSKHPQPSLAAYTPTFQESKTDEWDLRQLLAVVRRRAVVIGGVAIGLTATFWYQTLSHEVTKYEGIFQLLVEPVKSETENRLAALSQTPGTNAAAQVGLDYDTQIQVLLSPQLMAPVIKQISRRYPDISYGSLIGNLTISRFEQTKILEIRYQDSDPQKVQFVLQELAQGYLKYSTQERQSNLSQGIQFIASQQPKLQSQVNSLQKQLQQFRQQNDFVDPEVKAGQLAQQASTVKLQRLHTQQDLAENRALYATFLAGRSSDQLDETSILPTLQDPSGAKEALKQAAYQKIVAQLRDVERQIAAELNKNSSNIQVLRQKRESLLPLVRQEAGRLLEKKVFEVGNQISLLEVRAAQIAKAESNLNQQLQQLPNLIRQYNDLQRELKIATERLNQFVQSGASLQIDSVQQKTPWQVIATPQLPQVPIPTNLQQNLILGAIAGLLAGIGAALLAESLDNVFHSPDELKEVTKIPVLGRIPFHRDLKQIAPVAKTGVEKKPDGYKLVFSNLSNPQSESYFPFLEAFRSLHTTIDFLGSDTPIHSLVVSSAVPTDGKSTVALNLAQAAADMGKRVLLVDADLRLPQMHTRLGLSNEQGLSNVISTNLPVLEVIQRSSHREDLFVLTSGQIPPDPIKLLSSKKMQNIMEELRQKFDLVIYDTPPLLGLADSSIVAARTVGILLVTRIGKTDRSLLKQALEQLKLSGTSVLGIVCNGVKNYNKSAYNYYHRARMQSRH